MTNKLLSHPEPFENECLTSYINRLSILNVLNISTLLNFFGISESYTSRSLNYIKDNDVIEKIAAYSFLTVCQIKDMVVNKYIQDPWNINPRFTDSDSSCILVYKTKYCPDCIKEKLYNRLYWQINYITVCLKHQKLLLRACKKCNRSLSPLEVSNGKCNCGYNLSNDSSIQITNEDILSNQKRLYSIFKIGNNNFDSHQNLGLNQSLYLKLMSFLYSLIMKCKNQETMVNYSLEESPKFMKTIISFEDIIRNWPKSAMLLLQDMYDTEFDIIATNLKNISNPLSRTIPTILPNINDITGINILNNPLKVVLAKYYGGNILEINY